LLNYKRIKHEIFKIIDIPCFFLFMLRTKLKNGHFFSGLDRTGSHLFSLKESA